jgi:restriction endonuclease S subunit
MSLEWKSVKLSEIARIDFGTRVTQKRDSGTMYPVYGGGGETFRVDLFNRNSCLIVSRFAMSEQCVRFVDGKFFLNDSGLTVSATSEEISQQFLDHVLMASSKRIYSLGRGTAQKNLDLPKFRELQIPVPPIESQAMFVAQLNELSSLIAIGKSKAREQMVEFDLLQDRILELFLNGELDEKKRS